jgi:hypothetical protein
MASGQVPVFLIVSRWPEWGLRELLSGVDPAVLLLSATLALLAIDVAFLALGTVRFRRDKLITTR